MGRMRAAMATIGVAAAVAAGCGGDDGDDEAAAELPEAEASMALTTTAFEDGGTIPEQFTCDGEDVSPELAWTGVPEGAAELAIVMVDPGADGGTFAHWGLAGIPADATGLAEGEVPAGATEVRNGFDTQGWAGPCPPEGDDPHTYEFTVLALSEAVDLGDDATVDDLVTAVADVTEAQGELVGTYGR